MAEPERGDQVPATPSKPLPEHFEPWQPGNELAIRHGGFSLLRLDDRVTELAALLHERMGRNGHPSFDAAIQAAALAGAKLERAQAAIDKQEPSKVSKRLEDEASRWWTRWVQALDRLGLTPLAASKMGLNLALTGAAGRSLKQRAEDDARPSGEQPRG